MAENQTDSTKVGTTPAPNEENLSLEDLDAAISAEDPDFAEAINSIGPNEEMQVSDIGALSLEYTLADEEALWKHAGGWRSALYKAFPSIAKKSFKVHAWRLKLREKIIHLKVVLKAAGPQILKYLLGKIKSCKAGIGKALETFKYFSAVKKITFLGFLVFVGLASFVVYRSATKGLFPETPELFLGSLQEWAQETQTYDPATETEFLFESTHSAQNMMLLPRMVVNLKRSAGAGPNPMAAFEFYIEGSVMEVVVEIKDREAEVKDLFQRNIEDLTFEQASSGEGKQLLTEKLRKEVNKILTKGKVRRIFIKSAIVKP